MLISIGDWFIPIHRLQWGFHKLKKDAGCCLWKFLYDNDNGVPLSQIPTSRSNLPYFGIFLFIFNKMSITHFISCDVEVHHKHKRVGTVHKLIERPVFGILGVTYVGSEFMRRLEYS